VTAIGTVLTLAGEPLLGLDPSIPSSLETGGFSFTSDSSEEPARRIDLKIRVRNPRKPLNRIHPERKKTNKRSPIFPPFHNQLALNHRTRTTAQVQMPTSRQRHACLPTSRNTADSNGGDALPDCSHGNHGWGKDFTSEIVVNPRACDPVLQLQPDK
jgi:hypothetical protein